MRSKAMFPERLRKVKFYIWKSLTLLDTLYIGFCIALGFILYKTLTIIPLWNYRLVPGIFVPLILLVFILPVSLKKPEIRIYHQTKWLILFLITPKRFKKLFKKEVESKTTNHSKVFKITSNKKNNLLKANLTNDDLIKETEQLNQMIKEQIKNIKRK
ncbi:hypothetical protein [Mycoplasma mycoides]|uniref:hypothetical protein n=1 Tax=Mycoplasma mycoides TaxID=2102 RepID=UPI00223ECCCF|nr:hypothetical protein [Mycoplasma mycoides]QVK02440.1 hypothetical protein I7637_02350 [Mycoplasma mycoides subsp. capri]QVK03255.1 hypothetical protein I7638_02355 [Mycoplasma mycoides subsp. capri]